MMTAKNDAFDDQVLQALYDSDDLATCLELCVVLSKPGASPDAIYAPVFRSLARMARRGDVQRRKFKGSAYVFFQTVKPRTALDHLDWHSEHGA